MQSMSDKELDQLFQSRFEGFESEPSASLWSSIENQLEPKAAKKPTIPMFWMAAASVVVILGAGLWFLKPEQKIYLQGKGQLAIKPQPVKVSPIEEPITEEIAVMSAPAIASVKVRKPQPRAEANEVAPSTETKELAVAAQTESQVVMARVELPEANEEPARTISGFAAEEVQPHSRRGEVHQTVLAMLPPENTDQDQPVQQRRKIKSVGDIVNFVVAKVDQRDDKLIELSEDDEGTKISGINLGLFKIKSKKR